MRSARALIIGLALLPLAGCATTQDRNARAKLDATRLLAARKAVVVTAPNPDVTVGKVALLHHDGAVAVVVELHNAGAKPLTDLPILVGLRRHGRETYLNRRANLAYFQSHLAAIGAGGDATWVFTTRRAKDLTGTPFATVGVPVSPPISSAASLPEISASPISGLGPSVRVRVRNGTDVPQYELPVYAFARRGTRYVAAGRATVPHLGTGQGKQLKLHLIGTTGGAQLSLQAQPSMFE